MSEPVKTMLLGVLAVGLVAWAVAVSIERPQRTAEDNVGTLLRDVTDAQAKVTSIKIVNFDAKTGKPQPFEVTKTKAGYTIPSHENYPADQGKHLAQAAASVSKLKVISVAGDKKAHEDFGVVDPEGAGVGLGAANVGTRVTLKDAKGDNLADFIIGKTVADAQGQRYVRLAGKNQVYTVAIDMQYLSTRFEDWIEKDLLQIDPLDLKKVALADYSVITEQRLLPIGGKIQPIAVPVGLNERSAMELSYDAKGLKWEVDKWTVFKDRKPMPEKMGAEQEVNQQKLDELKGALDDLQIADVRRKPAGLGGDIKEFIEKSPSAVESLVQRGFYPMEVNNPETGKPVFQVLSDQGDVVAKMSDGVEYVLRFGGVAGGKAAEEKPAKPEDKENPHEAKPAASKLLRYLFVVTRFNDSMVPKPELQKVPELNGAEAKDEKADAAKEDANKNEPKKDEPKKDEAKKEEPKKEEPKKEEAKKEEAKKKDAKGDEANKDSKQAKPKPDPEAMKKQRDEIVKENEMRLKEYETKVAAGKARVAKLNKRFSDWYYIIADETYQKIHLGQKEVIQKKTPKDDKKPGSPGAPGIPQGFDAGSLVPPPPGM